MDYPNESDAIRDNEAWMPESPEETKRDEDRERQKVTSSIGVIKDVLAWFDAKADALGSVDSLEINEGTDPNTALIVLSTAKRMRAEFQAKSAEFRDQFSQYLEEEESNE